MKAEWVRSIRDQCQDTGVPFFFKQWGGVRKGAAGRELDGRTYDAMPARSQNPIASARGRLEHLRELESRLSALL